MSTIFENFTTFDSESVTGRKRLFSLIGDMKSEESIAKMFNVLTTDDDNEYRLILCALYFIENDRNVFGRDLDIPRGICNLSAAFLLGLDTYAGIKLFFNCKRTDISSVANFLENEYNDRMEIGTYWMRVAYIVSRKVGHKNSLLDEYTKFNSNYDRENLVKKSRIKNIEELRFKLYGHDDNGDVRTLLAVKVVNGYFCLFREYADDFHENYKRD